MGNRSCKKTQATDSLKYMLFNKQSYKDPSLTSVRPTITPDSETSICKNSAIH